MAADCVTDTHGLVWYLEDSALLGVQAKAVFDACDQGECLVYIPTICLVEIVYLQEKGRIAPKLFEQLCTALAAGKTGLRLFDLTLEIARSMARITRTEVPDMPDRIVAATAMHLGLPLLTRDRKIQLSSVTCIW